MAGIILAALISHCFFMVFEITVDTIFICFCIDCEEYFADPEGYYMSDGLKKVMMEMKEHFEQTQAVHTKIDVECGIVKD